MTSSNQTNSGGSGGDRGDVRRADPDHAAVDVDAAAMQDQVRADAQALRESARRVESSVPANGEAATDPNAAAVQAQIRADHDQLAEQARRVESSVPANGAAATDPNAAAVQAQVRADHDQLVAQARRVEASVPANVRDTPIQPAHDRGLASEDNTRAIRNVDAAHENTEAAREGARRVDASLHRDRQ